MQKKHWQDWINLALGVWVFISPWIFRVNTETTVASGTAFNFYVVGLAIAIVALSALSQFRPWEEWTNLVLGAWLFLSPWILGFSTNTAIMWNALIVGALVVVFAISALPQVRRKTLAQ